MAERGLLSVWDYVILGLTLALSIGIGLGYGFCRGGQRNTREFLSANRQLGVFSTAVSICVSFINAILVVGVAAEVFFFGIAVALGPVPFVLAGLASQVFITLFYPLELTSVYEYLEMRFQSKTVKIIGVFLYLIQEIFFMGLASFAPATALEAVSGIPVWLTILINGLVAMFYTTLGGIKAVIWTDVLQCAIMLAGLFAVIIQGSISVGGMSEVWRLNDEWGRTNLLNFDPDPRVRHTVWSIMVGAFTLWAARFCVGQPSLQRFSNVSTMVKARCSVMINSVVCFILFAFCCLAGMTVFAVYASKGCDPLSARLISSTNQILPFYVVDALNYPGIPGLFISCLFSGALSTISSALSAMAAVVWKDILSENIGRRMTEAKRTRLTKALVVIFGFLCVGTGFAAQQLAGQILQASMSLLGAVAGPQFGLFILAAFFPWANWKGAAVGTVTGVAMTAWISVGASLKGVGPTLLPLPSTNCSAAASLSPFNVTATFDPSNLSFPTSTLSMTSTLSISSANVTLMNVTSPTPSASAPIEGLDNFYHISYMYYGAIGILSVVIVGLLVSLVTGGNKPGAVDPRYLVSVGDCICCCLPESLKARCRPEDSDKVEPSESSLKIHGDKCGHKKSEERDVMMKALEHELETLYVHAGSQVEMRHAKTAA